MKSYFSMKTLAKNLFQYGCYLIFGLCVVYLTLLSFFSTSSVQLKKVTSEWETERLEEHIFFLPDSPWKHLAVCLCLLLLLCFVFSFLKRKKGKLVWLCLPFFVFSVAFIFSVDLYPISDPGKILEIARQIKEQNYGQFAVGGYMHRYPDQAGIVLLYYGIHCLFGEKDYLAIQIWNAALLTGAYFFLGRIAALLWGDKDENAQNMTLLFCVIFFPALLYVTFVYGMIPGLAFSILAFYLQLEYMRTRRLAYGIGAAVSISFAIVWKTNSLIMFIAMFVFLVYDLIMEKGERKKKTWILLAALIVIQRFSAWTVDAVMEGLTGIEPAEGMPKTAWIGMGLQETGGAPGVWNGYSVSLYEENGYDYDKTNEAAKEKIMNQILIFLDDRSYGVDFFGRKNAAQWNDPAFGSLSVVDGREEDCKKKLDNLCHGPWKYRLTEAANYLQSAVLAGVCFYLFLGRRGQKRGEMLLGIAVTGGLLFHMFWEAKPQYVLPYFVLLLPYCGMGYSGMVKNVLALWKERKRNADKTRDRCLFAAIGAGIICAFIGMISLLSDFRIISYTVHIQSNPEYLEQYEEAVQGSLKEYEERQE